MRHRPTGRGPFLHRGLHSGAVGGQNTPGKALFTAMTYAPATAPGKPLPPCFGISHSAARRRLVM